MIKKNNKSFFVFVFILFLGIVSSIPVVLGDAAGNYRDTRATANVSAYKNYYTVGRGKWDYTSSYAYNDGSTMAFKAAGVGRYSSTGTIYTNAILDSVTVYKGQSKYIRQWVKEKGYSYGSLRITPNSGGYLSFLWSPDSI